MEIPIQEDIRKVLPPSTASNLAGKENYWKWDAALKHVVAKVTPTDQDSRLRQATIDNFTSFIHKEIGLYRIEVYGSWASGIFERDSDLDFAIIPVSSYGNRCSENGDDSESKATLQHVGQALKRKGSENVLVIANARVPIVKFKDPWCGFECDVRVSPKSEALKAFVVGEVSRLDEKIVAMQRLVKRWAKKKDLHDGARQRMNSYTINLLVLFFFQCHGGGPFIPPLAYFLMERKDENLLVRRESRTPWRLSGTGPDVQDRVKQRCREYYVFARNTSRLPIPYDLSTLFYRFVAFLESWVSVAAQQKLTANVWDGHVERGWKMSARNVGRPISLRVRDPLEVDSNVAHGVQIISNIIEACRQTRAYMESGAVAVEEATRILFGA